MPALIESARDDGRRRRALLLLATSATFFGIMAFAAKLASATISGAQVAAIRFMVSLVPFVVFPRLRRAAFTFQRLDLLFYRGFFGGLAVLLYFMAIQHTAVGIATLLNYTTPLFSGVFAALLIGEPIPRRALLPLAVAILGVTLVLEGSATAGQPHAFSGWQVCALASAMLSGAAVTAIRVARRTESSWAIFASFSLFGLLATFPFAVSTWKTPEGREWLYLATVAVSSIVAQLLMTYAFRWVETMIAGIISQLAVVISMVLGIVWLGERLSPTSAVGSLLTITGVIAVMLIGGATPASAFDDVPEP